MNNSNSIRDRIKIFLLGELAFIDANDVDYPFSNIIVTSDGTSEYKINGKTHGLMSHAIKHLLEFDIQTVQKDVNGIIQILEKNKDKLKYIHKTKGEISPVQISNTIALSSLDYINDKIKNRKPLSEVEKQIEPLLNDISDTYKKFIEDFMRSSVNVTDNEDRDSILSKLKKGMIHFNVSYGDERIYLNLNRSVIIITSLRRKNAVKTMFKLSNGKTRALEILRNRYINNPEVEEAIKLF